MFSGSAACLSTTDCSIAASLWDLKTHDALVDMTIVCETGEELQVHSLVIYARSKFFRRLLDGVVGGNNNSFSHGQQSNTMIAFVDGSTDALRCIVRFLYFGEVDVPSSVVADFLSISRKLELEGMWASIPIIINSKNKHLFLLLRPQRHLPVVLFLIECSISCGHPTYIRSS
jgi:hypothetical protein